MYSLSIAEEKSLNGWSRALMIGRREKHNGTDRLSGEKQQIPHRRFDRWWRGAISALRRLGMGRGSG